MINVWKIFIQAVRTLTSGCHHFFICCAGHLAPVPARTGHNAAKRVVEQSSSFINHRHQTNNSGVVKPNSGRPSWGPGGPSWGPGGPLTGPGFDRRPALAFMLARLWVGSRFRAGVVLGVVLGPRAVQTPWRSVARHRGRSGVRS